MTTTNVYQGLASDKSTSRVLQAPGGSSSNIFGHYHEESDREDSRRKQKETEAVINGINKADANGDAKNNFMDNRDSFAANKQRNHGDGAPFATVDSLVSTSAGVRQSPYEHHPPPGADQRTPKQMQAANRERNQGGAPPFAIGDNEEITGQLERPAHDQRVLGNDYQTPQQRQANNPNKASNSFSNLFGDSDTSSPTGKSRGQVSQFNPVTWSAKAGARSPPDAFSPTNELAVGAAGSFKKNVLADDHVKAANPHAKVSTHNPVTWEAYSNFDAEQDHPQHRSRFENFAATKAGTFNPITGQDHVATPGSQSSTRVQAPPGGKSSIQF